MQGHAYRKRSPAFVLSFSHVKSPVGALGPATPKSTAPAGSRGAEQNHLTTLTLARIMRTMAKRVKKKLNEAGSRPRKHFDVYLEEWEAAEVAFDLTSPQFIAERPSWKLRQILREFAEIHGQKRP